MDLEKKVFLFEREQKSPSLNLAINQYCVSLVKEGKFDFIGRTYYHTPGVILGYNESIEDVNQDFCVKSGLEIVRRPSGGSAVIVDPKSCICYTLIFDSDRLGIKKDITEIYRNITFPLARRLGNGTYVEGIYYLRTRVNGKSMPFAGHAIKLHNGVVQFDGVVNRVPFDMDILSQALNLRALYELNNRLYVRSNGKVYDTKSNIVSVNLRGTKPIRDEREELSKMPSLQSLSISDDEFIEHLYLATSEYFGGIKVIDKIDFDQEVLESFRKKLKSKTKKGGCSGLGHCFVDLVEPEPTLHYG